ncbi:hypothetical protein D918_09591 [Trichuris suis]|nr:hypothetical protein D918_09591 [Trichuris suis]
MAEVLTLTTPKGLRRMKRLPYGVDVAPRIFQRLMETLLQGIPGVKPYLDDILITGPNEAEYDKRLEQVLKVLEASGLRLKKQKCHFATKEMEFWAIESRRKISILPKKATVLEPLHRLLDATAKSNWHWSDKEQAAFEAAKELLTAESVLARFDGNALMMGTEEDDATDEVNMLDAKTVAGLTRKDPVLSRVQHWVLHGWPSGL